MTQLPKYIVATKTIRYPVEFVLQDIDIPLDKVTLADIFDFLMTEIEADFGYNDLPTFTPIYEEGENN